MIDDTGCPVPCPECGAKIIRLIIGNRTLEHNPNFPIADLQSVAEAEAKE